MLLCLLSGSSCQTVYSLDIEHCQITESYYKLITLLFLKQTKPGHHIDPLEFYQYVDPKICVLPHVDQYISQNEYMRTDDSKKLPFLLLIL